MTSIHFSKTALAMMAFAVAEFISLKAGNALLGVAALCFVIWIYRNRQTLRVPDRTYYGVIGGFVGVMLLSALTSGDIGRGMSIWSNSWFWRLVPFFIMTLAVAEKRAAERVLGFSLVGLGLDMLCVIWQGIGGDPRASGFFGHPMTFAGYACLYLPVLFILFMEKEIPSRLRQAGGVLFVLGAVALFFNGTRGAWLGAWGVIALLLLYYLFQKKKLAIIMLCLFLIGGVGMTTNEYFVQRAESITDTNANSERFLIWHSAYAMFEDHPVLGVGLGQYTKNYQEKYISPEAQEPLLEHAHNNFLQMLAENGILGFASFCALIACFIGVSLKRFWKYRNPYALMMAASTLALVLQGMTEYNFGNGAVMKCFWLLEGCLLVLSWRDEEIAEK